MDFPTFSEDRLGTGGTEMKVLKPRVTLVIKNISLDNPAFSFHFMVTWETMCLDNTVK